MSKDAQLEFQSDKPRDKGGAAQEVQSDQNKGHWTYNDDTGIFIWLEHDTQHSLVDLPPNEANAKLQEKVNQLAHHPQDKGMDDPPQQPLIGGYKWDTLKNIIRNPEFKLNDFFEDLPEDQK